MGSLDALDRAASHIEADGQVHNPLELLEPFMNGPETRPFERVDRIWRVAVTQSSRTAVKAALGDSLCAEWQNAWGQFESSLREQLARVAGKSDMPQMLENLLIASRASEAMPLFLDNVRALETSLRRLRTLLAFHWSDEDNAYRRQENQLSGTVSQSTADPDRRQTLAREILTANRRYQEIYLPKLEALRTDVAERWTRCEALSPFFPVNKWPEVEQWLCLARKAVHSRLAGIEMAQVALDMDIIVPQEVASGTIRVANVDGKSTEVLSEGATARMKGHAERMQKLVQALHEEDDGPRRTLAATLLAEPSHAEVTTGRTVTKPVAVTRPRYHPVQRSAWFRLGQIAWWGGLAMWVIVVSTATESVQSWITGTAIGVVLFIGVKSAVLFVVLGRTTLHERPGSGFIDLDEFRQEMLVRGSLDDSMSAEFDKLRERYGRRIPAPILQGWLDRSLSDLRDEKRTVIADADRQGTTISVDSLRRTLLARSEATDEYLAYCDELLLRLEVEHGPEIPLSVVSEIADSAVAVNS